MNTIEANGQNSSDSRQVVTFTIGQEEYAVPILSVREIIRRVESTAIPCSGPGIEGIINLRGTIIPVVHMADRLNIASQDGQSDDQRIVVLDIGRSQVGFLVDRVKQVIRVDAAQIAAPPRLGQGHEDFLDGVAKLDDRLVLLISPSKLTNEDIDEATVFAEQQSQTQHATAA
ncbi:MAG: chemotaxis protein CheW [Planctomycetota bacterium]